MQKLLKIQQRLQADYDDLQIQNKQLLNASTRMSTGGGLLPPPLLDQMQKQHNAMSNRGIRSSTQIAELSLQAKIDDMMLQHSQVLDVKNAQVQRQHPETNRPPHKWRHACVFSECVLLSHAWRNECIRACSLFEWHLLQ